MQEIFAHVIEAQLRAGNIPLVTHYNRKVPYVLNLVVIKTC